jgi:TonB family protein
MYMRLFTTLALLAMSSSAIAAADPASAVVDVTWDVSLDTAGHVVALSTKDERVPTLHARLEKAIRAWQFTAGRINGVPARTETHLQTQLDIRVIDDTFQVRLLSAHTGASYVDMLAPAYPESAGRAGKQGGVALKVHYGTEGAIDNVMVAPYESSTKTDQRLIDAAIAAVRKWTITPEVVGGLGMAGEYLIPICFQLDRHPAADCKLRNAATGETIDGGRSVALDPAAALETQVAGQLM